MSDNNFLNLVPQINEGLNWNKDENDIVTLEIENRGLFNRIAQKVFKKPKISYVHLDKLGSFVWLQTDSKRNIAEISDLVKEHFGDEAKPFYERTAKYFQILESYKFVYLKSEVEIDG